MILDIRVQNIDPCNLSRYLWHYIEVYISRKTYESPRGVVANVSDCDIMVILNCNRNIFFEKGVEILIPSPDNGLAVLALCFLKDDFAIKQLTKDDMPLGKKTCRFYFVGRITISPSLLPIKCFYILYVIQWSSSSIPGRVIPKTLKMVLDTALLNTQ